MKLRENIIQTNVLNDEVLNFINLRQEQEFEPYYVYDTRIIRDNCRVLNAIPWQNKSIHFASMANINPEFLRVVRQEGINVFVNSVGHMNMALQAGFRQEDIILTASALTCKTMTLLESLNIQCNVDSPAQLEQWQKLFPSQPIGIRCNIGGKVEPQYTHGGYFIGSESRLGFTLDEIYDIKDKAFINGLHLYVGTDLFDVDYFMHCYRALIEISMDFPNIVYLNFGGGFGVCETGEYKFDFRSYHKGVSELMKEASRRKKRNLKLILEPGRIIGGEAGYFVCCVSDIKHRCDKLLVGVNASTVQFSRPLLYPDVANHPVTVIRHGQVLPAEDMVNTTIYGCSTYSRDIFAHHRLLPKIQTGDVLVFGVAGSYSASSYSQFLGFEKPKEYFI
jgi:diaminopimelate decarboxylase